MFRETRNEILVETSNSRKSRVPSTPQMRDYSDQSTRIPLKSLPRTIEEATRLVRKLGYSKARVFALETDRLAAVTQDDQPFTLAFQYDPDSETVKVVEIDGWPVE